MPLKELICGFTPSGININCTSAGWLLIPEGIILPVVSVSALTFLLDTVYLFWKFIVSKICN